MRKEKIISLKSVLFHSILLSGIILSSVYPQCNTTTAHVPSTSGPSNASVVSTSKKSTMAPQKATSFSASKSTSSKPKTTSITISAAGDCTLGSDRKSPASVNFYAKYRQKNPSYFFKNVKSIFQKDDLTLVNFEGTLTKRNTPAIKKFTFKGNPSYINILKKGSVEAVSFANNHCHDFRQGSYTDTINTFKKSKMTYSSYNKVAIYKTKGKKIGMISVCGLDGISISQQYIKNGMKKLKKAKADLIIVSMHAGIEHTSRLDTVQKKLAHYAVNHGANLVLGHHPHVLQGIERYKGVYIVYSLGNFCFGGNTNPSDKDTMIYQQTFTFKGKKLSKKRTAKIIPCRISSTTSINNYQPTPLKGKARKRVINRMNRYSKSLHVTISKSAVLK